MFLVLLRTAIGWHFLYEGTQKILSTPEGKATILADYLPVPEGPAFSSEGYLRASTGPFAQRFRSLIPDADSRDKLDLARLKASMSDEVDRIAAFYDFNDAQRADARKSLESAQKNAEGWFLSPESIENRQKVDKYLADLAEVEAVERNPDALDYERKNAAKDRKDVEAARKELAQVVDAWVDTLRDAVVKLATDDQKQERALRDKPAPYTAFLYRKGPELDKLAGVYRPPLSSLDKIDRVTMYGLSAVGLCLMLGLFTPLAALGTAAYLASFYLSMPPWPGLPEGITEGHYRYVNKNLIEMLACLALAATPNGLWVGLDALLFGWIGRGRRRRELAEALALEESLSGNSHAGTGPGAGPNPGRPTPTDRRKFKSR